MPNYAMPLNLADRILVMLR